MENRPRIGILTFHRAINFGALLQAYGLYTVISSNYDVEIINYIDPVIENRYKIFDNNSSLEAIFKKVLLFPFIVKQRKKFDEFRKKMKLSAVVNEENISMQNYDVTITGSDQVWNYTLTEKNQIYLLNWVNENGKRYSYAASIGVESIDEVRDIYIKSLKKFDVVSVRERHAQDMLRSYGIQSCVNIDPVFLIDKEHWERISILPKIKYGYVLVYTIGHSEELIRSAKTYAEEKGLKVLYISDTVLKSNGMKIIRGIGPSEWLGYFAHADFIFTNSFHGTAFSIIFNKYFLVNNVMTNLKSTNSRLENLLQLFDLQSRKINQHCKSIHWQNVNCIIESERSKAIKYINYICS